MHRLHRCFYDQFGDIQPDGTGGGEETGAGQPQAGMPDRRIGEENELAAIHIRKPRMRGQ